MNTKEPATKTPSGQPAPAQDHEPMQKSINALRESEQRYRNIFTNSPLGIYYYRPDGYLTECNDKFLEILGSKREKVIGLYILSTVKDPKMLAAIKASLEGKPGTFEGEYLSMSSGHRVYIKASYGPMYSERGDLIGGIGIIEDISERMSIEKELREAHNSLEKRVRKRTEDLIRANESLEVANEKLKKEVLERKSAEEAVRESKKLLNSVLDNSTTVIYAKDLEGRYILINKIFESLFHVKEQWIIGKTDYDLFPKETADAFRVNDLKVIETGAPVEFDEVVPHDDGVHTYISVKIPIFSTAGEVTAVCGISTDITERKRAIEEKEHLQAQLIQAQKMEAIGTLAGGIAHDFNNILTVIKNLTSLALDKASRDPNCTCYLEPMREVSERGINLVQQLLIFSQNKPVEFTIFNLNDVIDDFLKIIGTLISEDILLEKELEGGLADIKADKGRIEQVITNLVINSRDSMLMGGVITLRTENVTLTTGQAASIQGAVPGDFVCLTVQDTGTGISKHTVEHIFEPFFTTKSPNGTGLGLSVVYGIVKELNGWINVESEPDRGTKFMVYLPVAEGAEKSVPEEPAEKKTFDGKGRQILLVEDDKWVRKSTAMVLRENGYVVFEASSAEQAINLFFKKKGQFDLVISDVVMPGRNGLQLVGPLLDVNPKIPILLCSGHLDDKAQLEQIVRRGLPYIQKPYEIDELLQAVEEIIGNSLKSRYK